MRATITIDAALGRKILSAWTAEDAYYASPCGFTPALPPYEGRCGFTSAPVGGRWLTSGGNLAVVTVTADAATLTLAGRRHGVREIMAWTLPDPADLAVLHAAPATCDSTAPWPWWKTADDAVVEP